MKNHCVPLFDPTFLDSLLKHPDSFDDPLMIPLERGELSYVELGVWEYRPNNCSLKQSFILSCGIHGNETAPIEIINDILQDILEENLFPKVPLLIIFGNPPAMFKQQRFIDFNLNRTFAGNHQYLKQEYWEKERGKRLEELTLNFSGHGQDQETIHYDLHTAIRPSVHQKFVVSPFNQEIAQEQIEILSEMGIEAILLGNKPSTTFSYFTSAFAYAKSYTLELGKVESFGQNIRANFAACERVIRELLEQKFTNKEGKSDSIKVYQVKKELIRNHENYEFNIPDDTINFTSFKKGTLLAKDPIESYITEEDGEAIVFPKGDVPVGQRTGLVLIPVKLP